MYMSRAVTPAFIHESSLQPVNCSIATNKSNVTAIFVDPGLDSAKDGRKRIVPDTTYNREDIPRGTQSAQWPQRAASPGTVPRTEPNPTPLCFGMQSKLAWRAPRAP